MSEIIFPISLDDNEYYNSNNNYTLAPVIQDPLYEVEEHEAQEDEDSIHGSPANSIFSDNYANSYDDDDSTQHLIPDESYFYSKLQNRLYSAVPRDITYDAAATDSTNFEEYNFANIAQDNYKLWLSTV
ncbi:hypothetical protein RNJ44_01280 [Nakaseomyces bracarensis]|uniref:Uncharacterized protein n=1 Tax=Nakaseomyces bracarensis TaxID=273131 RepID=A0ABR4NRE1_9SACH